MIVAVALVRVVQVVLYQVIHVIAVWDSLVSAIWPVNMARLMSATAMIFGTPDRVGRADFNLMLVYPISTHILQVAVLKIVHVTIVLHRFVAASGTVSMTTPAWIDTRVVHGNSPFGSRLWFFSQL
jgi:hypothetical protein